MRLKFLSLIAALALVSACESAPEDGAGSAGGGAAAGSIGQRDLSVEEGTKEDFVVNVGDRVHFELDKFNLNSAAQATLDKQAAWLHKFPTANISIEGHCDERGTREYNLALGERRANSVKDYLVALGISASRITTISYGKERPVALGSNEDAWAQNRRAVTKINAPGG
ncbi:MAG TPA: peptidoglycan-associated lipoprotein Pal [Rhodospirillales bacterium]|nr:peptidoglycan-associated lipoprotein Pal [Rhodospirillales bacterium]